MESRESLSLSLPTLTLCKAGNAKRIGVKEDGSLIYENKLDLQDIFKAGAFMIGICLVVRHFS